MNKTAFLLLFYGLFAVLCQLTALLLFAQCALTEHSILVLRHEMLPYLEYPLMSIALLLGGAVTLESVTNKKGS